MHHLGSRRRALVALAASLSIAAALAPSATFAAPSGVVTVTGGSQTTLELTIADSTADFGSGLTPDGTGAAGGITTYAAIPGSCFKWDGQATVRSNILWKVQQVAAANNAKVRFFSTEPVTYAQCTTGSGLSTTAATWATGNRTASSPQSFWLSADVLWTDAPDPTFADASVTLTVSSQP
jgi:hypothetical protein